MAEGNKGKLALSEKVYDFGKESATIYIPALVVLYVALAAIWHLPHPVEVAGTGAAVTTFLGVVLKISNSNYQANGGSADGTVHVDNGFPTKLAVGLSADELSQRQSIVLNVVPDASAAVPEVTLPAGPKHVAVNSQ